MFDRFTERAIKVLMLTQEEARRMGHNFADTEQLLLGLICESDGVAARALRSMGVKLSIARIEVEKLIGSGSGFVAVEIPFTPRAVKGLKFAVEAAKTSPDGLVDTEHLLLGITHDAESGAVRVLQNLGVDIQTLEQQISSVLADMKSAEIAQNSDVSFGYEQIAQDQGLQVFVPRASAVAAKLCSLLFQWVEPRTMGRVLLAPYVLVHIDIKNSVCLRPHVALLTPDQLQAEATIETVPRLVAMVEAGSSSTRKAILNILLECGATVGIRIDLTERTVTVLRKEHPQTVILHAPTDVLTIPELLPSWEVPISDFWVF